VKRVNNHYISRKKRLLREFDETAVIAKDLIVSRYDKDFANELRKETRKAYEELIPQIPYIKGFPTLRRFFANKTLIVCAQELAVYKILKRHGRTAEEAWELCHDVLRSRLKRAPVFTRWMIRYLTFSKLMRTIEAKIQRKSSGDFLARVLEGDGEKFDFGVDYIECPIYKFMCEQGAGEFAPYICLSDILLSDAFGWGLMRTGTLAEGCDRCDFRFKKGGKTRISSRIPEIQAMLERLCKKTDL